MRLHTLSFSSIEEYVYVHASMYHSINVSTSFYKCRGPRWYSDCSGRDYCSFFGRMCMCLPLCKEQEMDLGHLEGTCTFVAKTFAYMYCMHL